MTKLNNNPSVSVIIPTYNCAHLINRAIQSILNQTYQDFEIIVVDDGSKDNTEEVVKGFKDKRIRYLRHDKNMGEGATRNTGIKASRCEYIAFQDSDDECFPEKLEKQMKVFEKQSSKVGMVYTNMYRIDKRGKKHSFKTPAIMPDDGFVYRRALDYQLLCIGVGTAIILKKCFKKVGLFDERLPYYVDMDFFIRLSKYFYFYHISEPLYKYYATERSLSSNPKSLATSRKMILAKYFDDIKKDKKTLAKHYLGIGNDLCRSREIKEGINYLIKSIEINPLNIKSLLVIISSLLLGRNIFNKITNIYQHATYI